MIFSIILYCFVSTYNMCLRVFFFELSHSPIEFLFFFCFKSVSLLSDFYCRIFLLRSNKVFISSCKALWPRTDYCHFTDFFICCLPLISNEIFWLKYEFFHMQLHHRILLVYFCCMSPLTFCCYIIVVCLFVLNRIWSRRFSRWICSVI